MGDCGSDALLLLPLSRWREKTEAIRSNLRQIVDIPSLIEEWAKEVVRPHLRFNSRIAQLPSGQALTVSWRLYSEMKFDRAYQAIGGRPLSNSLVMQLSSISKIMSLIHIGHTFDEQIDIETGKLALPLASALYANKLLRWYKTRDASSFATELKSSCLFHEIGSATAIIDLLPLAGEDKFILHGNYMDFERLTAGEYGDLLFFLGSVYAEIKGDKEKAMYLIDRISQSNGGSLPEFLQYF